MARIRVCVIENKKLTTQKSYLKVRSQAFIIEK